MNVNRINDDNDELTNEKQRMCNYFLVGNSITLRQATTNESYIDWWWTLLEQYLHNPNKTILGILLRYD